MEIRDRIRDRVEQLAPSVDGIRDSDPFPRGEDRDTAGPEDDDAGLGTWLLGHRVGAPSEDAIGIETSDAPESIADNWQNYYKEFGLTRAALTIFDEDVVEPGYRISVEDADGERDEDMEDALKLWAENCAIHGGETHQDFREILANCPSQRRGKGTVLIEKVGTRDDPDALAALMFLDPSTFKIYVREDQPILAQPDDDVSLVGIDVDDVSHLETPSGDTAAYVQYDDALANTPDDKNPIPFSADDIIKLTYDADTGEIWGTSVFDAVADRIDALRQKLADRDVSIRQTGYPHRIYNSETWTKEEARDYAEAHAEGDVSSEYGPDSDHDTPGGEKPSFAGRVDFVSDNVDVQVEEGSVPDLEGAVMDDVQQIFSVMPVSRFKIAYEEDINQFVVEPQNEKDSKLVDSERGYLERKFQPVFQEKADELAGGSYGGEVTLKIEPREQDNPLRREGFPADNLEAFATYWQSLLQAGADAHIPPEAMAEFAGFDLEDVQETYEWEADPLEMPDEQDSPENLPPEFGGDGGEGQPDDEPEEGEGNEDEEGGDDPE